MEAEMHRKGRNFLWAIIMVFLCCVSCATTQRRDVESDLIAAMEAKCKSVEIKADGEVYVIGPTQKLSENGCPIALIKGWRDGRIIREEEVEICACKNRQNR
jgi:hypothetical protein